MSEPETPQREPDSAHETALTCALVGDWAGMSMTLGDMTDDEFSRFKRLLVGIRGQITMESERRERTD